MVTIVFQAPCLQKQPSRHLGTTGDTTAIRSLCCWLIVHDISMGSLLQGHVYPVPHHCVDAKKGHTPSRLFREFRVRNLFLDQLRIIHLTKIHVRYIEYMPFFLT